LQLQTHWWWWRIACAVFMWTLNWIPESMYGPKFHSLNGGNTLDWETLNWANKVLYCMELWFGSQKMNSKCQKSLDWET
jgi:hypothetical protein